MVENGNKNTMFYSVDIWCDKWRKKTHTEHKRARNAIETEMDNSYEVAIEQK